MSMPAPGDFRDNVGLVRRAASEGLADGLREHLPGGVGIVIKGGAACAVAAVLHFGLGLDVPATVIGSALSGAGLAWAKRR